MVDWLKRRMTFSNVVALLALFFALAGTVYAANKISGKQIKANSIPGNRIKSSSLGGGQIKPGSVGGDRLQADSVTGTEINESTLSGVSAASLANVQYASVVVHLVNMSTTGDSGTANCPPGTKVIGGGTKLSDETVDIINDSGPDAARTGWSATGYAFGADGTTMTVTAICTAVGSSSG